ncbi:MAG: TetR-like C-terminal domain-containing protein, partial [Pseudolysinimonas sp.]
GFLVNADAARFGIAAVMSVQLAQYFRDTGTSFSELRDELRGTQPTGGVETIVARAVDRGELPSSALPGRVITLPFDLMRHEMFMTMRPIPKATLIEFVDVIWLPLLRQFGARV